VGAIQVPSILLSSGAPDVTIIVNELRLPRVVRGMLVGLAFGISGAIFRSLVQKELARPDVIGISPAPAPWP
jgi:iron complex transport system permease protein